MLLCSAHLTAYCTDFLALAIFRFPYESMTRIPCCAAAGTDASVPFMLRRSDLSANPADALAQIPFMALISRFPALQTFTAIPLMKQTCHDVHSQFLHFTAVSLLWIQMNTDYPTSRRQQRKRKEEESPAVLGFKQSLTGRFLSFYVKTVCFIVH